MATNVAVGGGATVSAGGGGTGGSGAASSSAASAPSSKNKCGSCGSTHIDQDPSRGDAVCMNCGEVLEASLIVSDVQFEENAHGGSSAIGTFVSGDTKGGGLGGAGGGGGGGGGGMLRGGPMSYGGISGKSIFFHFCLYC